MEKESLTKSICLCCKCNRPMEIDDTDFNFKGNYKRYWFCSVCDVFCYEKVRFNKVFTREYTDSNDKVLKIVRGV